MKRLESLLTDSDTDTTAPAVKLSVNIMTVWQSGHFVVVANLADLFAVIWRMGFYFVLRTRYGSAICQLAHSILAHEVHLLLLLSIMTQMGRWQFGVVNDAIVSVFVSMSVPGSAMPIFISLPAPLFNLLLKSDLSLAGNRNLIMILQRNAAEASSSHRGSIASNLKRLDLHWNSVNAANSQSLTSGNAPSFPVAR